MEIEELKKDLGKLANPKKTQILARFFKTGKGEYGEGDVFLGLTSPQTQQVARKYLGLSLKNLQELLESKIHEYRSTALVILVNQYHKADEKEREIIAGFYLKNSKNINNWDLVDMSAPHIPGHYFLTKDRLPLYRLAQSANLWERRIAIMATLAFIRQGQYADTLKIAEILLNDKHDLIHKAVGWMLREVGKRDQETEEQFLRKHYKVMPRTMLRYAIEKFEEKRRKFYLVKGAV